MKKRFNAAILMLAVLAAAVAGGCASKDTVTADYGSELDLSRYGSFYEMRITAPDRAVFTPGNERLLLDQLGTYQIRAASQTISVTVEDLSGPVINFIGENNYIPKNTRIELPEVRIIDNYDGVISEYGQTLTLDGEAIAADADGCVTTGESGVYRLEITCHDSHGNKGQNVWEMEVGKGVPDWTFSGGIGSDVFVSNASAAVADEALNLTAQHTDFILRLYDKYRFRDAAPGSRITVELSMRLQPGSKMRMVYLDGNGVEQIFSAFERDGRLQAVTVTVALTTTSGYYSAELAGIGNPNLMLYFIDAKVGETVVIDHIITEFLS